MVKPLPAASIILYRIGEDGSPEFLMGRRSAAHRFMPHVFVFPGGRVDQADHEKHEGWACNVLPEARLDNLECGVDIFLTAAYRELEEETGYLPDVLSPKTKVHLIARAITPNPSPVRFDTLFFLAQADPASKMPSPETDELEVIDWYGMERIVDLDIANVTTNILDQAIETIRCEAKNSFYNRSFG